jgi:hypothetical protein
VAIAGLCWLIYSTFAAEIDNMLKPPTDMEPVYNAIDMITRASGRNEVGPSPFVCYPSLRTMSHQVVG